MGTSHKLVMGTSWFFSFLHVNFFTFHFTKGILIYITKHIHYHCVILVFPKNSKKSLQINVIFKSLSHTCNYLIISFWWTFDYKNLLWIIDSVFPSGYYLFSCSLWWFFFLLWFVKSILNVNVSKRCIILKFCWLY